MKIKSLKENLSKTNRNKENENYKIFFNLDSNNNKNNLNNLIKNIKKPKKPDFFKLKYHNGILMKTTEKTFRVKKQIKKSFSSQTIF